MDISISHWSAVSHFPLLTTLTVIPMVAMFAVLLSRSQTMATRYAFAGVSLTVILSIYLLIVFDAGLLGIQLVEHVNFAGLSYFVGVDGSNILFIPLTAILTLLTLTYSQITRNATDRIFIACLLAYETILMGAFSALNMLQFWFWCVLELAPVMLLTTHSGTGQKRRWVALRLMQFWVSGLLMTLAGFMFLAFGLIDSSHPLTFDWLILKQNNAYLHDEVLIFILLFFGFAIRMPLFPFHGWLPLLAEHGTVACVQVFLVGLKLGVYGIIRFILPIIPGVAEQWETFVLSLGLISIFYGGLLALTQINVRRLLAFAVISHTGLLIIGVFSFNEFGLEGSFLLSVVYGLATAGMFFSVGVVYERTRTAYLPRLGGLFDSNTTIALLFLISTLSTVVIPGTPGFDAAHLLMEGIIEEHGWLIAISILIGNVVTAAFLLRCFQQLFIATARRLKPIRVGIHHRIRVERIITLIICGLLIGTGFYTTPWLNFIEQDVIFIDNQFPMHSSLHSKPGVDPVNTRGRDDE